MATSILDSFLDPIAEILPLDTARKLADFRLDPQLQLRINALAEKASQGNLTESETMEYQQYVEGLDIVAIIQAKARLAIAKQA